jgi:glyoxalase family protein
MGFRPVGDEHGWFRYAVDGGAAGQLIEIQERPGERLGQWGTGGVHHVAWRQADAEEELATRQQVLAMGLRPTQLIDRFWFESVYFKEPGGALFELATDGPGFDRDEDPAHLGESLVLPPWYEAQRAEIEAQLPPLRLPGG